jgi:ubiquinol-cytochrome c reductase cytochrome c1 subunit
MSRLIPFLAIALLGLTAQLMPAFAADEKLPAKDVAFSFEGPFGTFDRAQVQRGYQVYKEVCSACHSMSLMRYRNLGEPGGPEFPPEQVKAIAAEYKVTDGPDASGNMFERPALPSDAFTKPFPNDNAARAANGGALPPDLSLITKMRAGWSGSLKTLYTTQLIKGMGGPEYVYSVLTGYQDPPPELAAEAPEGKHYNPYFENGHWIGMPPPLTEGSVTFADGTPATVDQMARDVSAFLAWAGEPKMEERKRIGFQVMVYLLVFAVLLYLVKRRIWGRHEP